MTDVKDTVIGFKPLPNLSSFSDWGRHSENSRIFEKFKPFSFVISFQETSHTGHAVCTLSLPKWYTECLEVTYPKRKIYISKPVRYTDIRLAPLYSKTLPKFSPGCHLPRYISRDALCSNHCCLYAGSQLFLTLQTKWGVMLVTRSQAEERHLPGLLCHRT